ncbi:MAG: hypothetical protein IAE89_06650 [Anaerolineae bacterium]|nr:hypothetical protein [Anaerolineae bacterium]
MPVLILETIVAQPQNPTPERKPDGEASRLTSLNTQKPILPPIPNYTLSSECPACGGVTIRRACKVHCQRCGFTWDCSEL